MRLRVCVVYAMIIAINGHYTPDWPSLDSRPLPEWYDKAKVGIFMHFGAYTVPGYKGAFFWKYWMDRDPDILKFINAYYSPQFTYQDFAAELKMKFFDPHKFAEIVNASGARYIVFTSKHCDGFVNFDSPYSFGWNSVNMGPKLDIIKELKAAFVEKYPNIHFGTYYSLTEWFHPLYEADLASNFTLRNYVKTKILPELKHLVRTYKPEILWSDASSQASPEYWSSKEFLAWLFNDSPTKDTVVTNDRWGQGTMMKHGSFFSGPDKYNPGVLQPHKFENCMTMDKYRWAYRHDLNVEDVLTPRELIHTMVMTVSCGGNILINVGPTKEGTIAPIFQERLKTLGSWLNINGDAIYDSVPWKHQNETTKMENLEIWYTARPDIGTVFGILFGWPSNERDQSISIKAPMTIQNLTEIRFHCLGSKEPSLPFQRLSNGYLKITFPSLVKVRSRCDQVEGIYTLSFKYIPKSLPRVSLINGN